jgi:hypothetical protein
MMATESRQGRAAEPGPDDGVEVPAVAGARAEAVPPAAVLGQDAWREQLAEQLLERARSSGVQLVGPDGLLAGVSKAVLENAL